MFAVDVIAHSDQGRFPSAGVRPNHFFACSVCQCFHRADLHAGRELILLCAREAEIALPDFRLERFVVFKGRAPGTGRQPCSTGSRYTCPCPILPIRSPLSKRRLRYRPIHMQGGHSACTGPSHRWGDPVSSRIRILIDDREGVVTRASHILENRAVLVCGERRSREVMG